MTKTTTTRPSLFLSFFPPHSSSFFLGGCLSIHTKHKKKRVDERAVESTVAMLGQRRGGRLKSLGNGFAALSLNAALVQLGNLAGHGP